MADTYDFSLDRSATFVKNVVWRNDAAVLVTDISSARMAIREVYGQPDPATLLLTSNPAAGLTITASAGRVAIEITPVQTETLTQLTYVYDLLVTQTGGTVTRLLEGTITINPEVTTP